LCRLAGIMYWSDHILQKIDMSYINGTGRSILVVDESIRFYSLAHFDGYIYFIDSVSAAT